MSIIKILVKTIIRITVCVIAAFGVFTEGLTRLLAKFANYLDTLDDKADDMFKKKVSKKTIDVPL